MEELKSIIETTDYLSNLIHRCFDRVGCMKKNNIFIIWLTFVLVFSAYLGITYFYNVPKATDTAFSIVGVYSNLDAMITFAVFTIVFVVFVGATVEFNILNKLGFGLKKASDSIEEISKNTTDSQWGRMSKDSSIFGNDLLQNRYSKYVEEINRLSQNGLYQCDITDYINKEFLDNNSGKNLLSIVPGVMTGLGILGTFIGLYLGLQGFKTGSAGEITESITPLMNGIKVAFVTSIIGMIFSLMFNYVYRKSYQMVYKQLDRFVSLHDRYVMNNSVYENENKLLSLINNSPVRFKEELSSLAVAQFGDGNSYLSRFYKMSEENNLNLSETKTIVSGISESLGASLVNILEPQFVKMNETLEALASNISTHTVAAIDESAKQFVESMNKSLGGSFERLGQIIDDTSKLQQQNNDMVQDVMNNLNDSVKKVMEDIDRISDKVMSNLLEVEEYSNETAKRMESFSKDLESYQKASVEYIEIINSHLSEHSDLEDNLKSYLDAMIAQQQSMELASKKFIEELNEELISLEKFKKDLVDTTQENINNITTITAKQLEKIAEMANQQINNIGGFSSDATGSINDAAEKLGNVANKLGEKLDTSIIQTFKTFDRELSTISKHLSGTILEIRDITDRIPKTLAVAIEGVETSFEGIQNSFDNMKDSLDKIVITKEQ